MESSSTKKTSDPQHDEVPIASGVDDPDSNIFIVNYLQLAKTDTREVSDAVRGARKFREMFLPY